MFQLSKAYQLRGKGKKGRAPKPGRAEPAKADGLRSGAEVIFFRDLLDRQVRRQVSNIRREVSMQLTPSVTHKLDFVVFDHARGSDIGHEVKGLRRDRDEIWAIKRRLYKDFAPFPICVWERKGEHMVLLEEIPAGKYTIAPLNI